MKPAIEKVAVLPSGDEAEGLDAHTARPTGDLTREVRLRAVLVCVIQTYLGGGGGGRESVSYEGGREGRRE